MEGDERKRACSTDRAFCVPDTGRPQVPQPVQPGLLEKEHRRVGRGLWGLVSCSLAAVLSAEPFVHLFHKHSPVLASPVQAVVTQWCPSCSGGPAAGRERAVLWGRHVNHVVSPSDINLDCSKFYVGGAPGLQESLTSESDLVREGRTLKKWGLSETVR